jgi:hypothetical protein
MTTPENDQKSIDLADLRAKAEAAREAAPDAVNHPTHYNAHPSGVECISVVEHMTFNAGNAVKYLWRAGLKGAPDNVKATRLEDLKKGLWYIQREIDRLEKLEVDR